MRDRKAPRPTRAFAAVLQDGWIMPSSVAWHARDVRRGIAADYGSWRKAYEQGWRVIRVRIVQEAPNE